MTEPNAEMRLERHNEKRVINLMSVHFSMHFDKCAHTYTIHMCSSCAVICVCLFFHAHTVTHTHSSWHFESIPANARQMYTFQAATLIYFEVTPVLRGNYRYGARLHYREPIPIIALVLYIFSSILASGEKHIFLIHTGNWKKKLHQTYYFFVFVFDCPGIK